MNLEYDEEIDRDYPDLFIFNHLLNDNPMEGSPVSGSIMTQENCENNVPVPMFGRYQVEQANQANNSSPQALYLADTTFDAYRDIISKITELSNCADEMGGNAAPSKRRASTRSNAGKNEGSGKSKKPRKPRESKSSRLASTASASASTLDSMPGEDTNRGVAESTVGLTRLRNSMEDEVDRPILEGVKPTVKIPKAKKETKKQAQGNGSVKWKLVKPAKISIQAKSNLGDEPLLRPKIWCDSKEELISAIPTLSKITNGISWEHEKYPVIFLEDHEDREGEAAIGIDAVKNEGKDIELVMTRDFTCLLSDLVDQASRNPFDDGRPKVVKHVPPAVRAALEGREPDLVQLGQGRPRGPASKAKEAKPSEVGRPKGRKGTGSDNSKAHSRAKSKLAVEPVPSMDNVVLDNPPPVDFSSMISLQTFSEPLEDKMDVTMHDIGYFPFQLPFADPLVEPFASTWNEISPMPPYPPVPLSNLRQSQQYFQGPQPITTKTLAMLVDPAATTPLLPAMFTAQVDPTANFPARRLRGGGGGKRLRAQEDVNGDEPRVRKRMRGDLPLASGVGMKQEDIGEREAVALLQTGAVRRCGKEKGEDVAKKTRLDMLNTLSQRHGATRPSANVKLEPDPEDLMRGIRSHKRQRNQGDGSGDESGSYGRRIERVRGLTTKKPKMSGDSGKVDTACGGKHVSSVKARLEQVALKASNLPPAASNCGAEVVAVVLGSGRVSENPVDGDKAKKSALKMLKFKKKVPPIPLECKQEVEEGGVGTSAALSGTAHDVVEQKKENLETDRRITLEDERNIQIGMENSSSDAGDREGRPPITPSLAVKEDAIGNGGMDKVGSGGAFRNLNVRKMKQPSPASVEKDEDRCRSRELRLVPPSGERVPSHIFSKGQDPKESLLSPLPEIWRPPVANHIFSNVYQKRVGQDPSLASSAPAPPSKRRDESVTQPLLSPLVDAPAPGLIDAKAGLQLQSIPTVPPDPVAFSTGPQLSGSVKPELVEQMVSGDQARIPRMVPPEILALIKAYVTGSPVVLLVTRTVVQKKWEGVLPPKECEYIYLGSFSVIGIQELLIENPRSKATAQGDDTETTTVTGRVQWRFRLSWGATGREWEDAQRSGEDTPRPWWTFSETKGKQKASSFDSDEGWSTEHYRTVRVNNSNYQFRDVPMWKKCFSVLPLSMEVVGGQDKKETTATEGDGDEAKDEPYCGGWWGWGLADESFPSGWHCAECGKVNYQVTLRHRCCASSFCQEGNPRPPYAYTIYQLRDPQQNTPISHPIDAYPHSMVEGSVSEWEDGMRTFGYMIRRAEDVVVKHIFTGNMRSLQEDADRFLEMVQLEVHLLRPRRHASPYFSFTVGPSASDWKEVPGCLSVIRDRLLGIGRGYGETELSINRLSVLAWVTTGSKKSTTTFSCVKHSIVIMFLGCEATLTLVPQSGLQGPEACRVVPMESGSSRKADVPWEDGSGVVAMEADEPEFPSEVSAITKAVTKGDKQAIVLTLVHGDAVVLSGDRFEYSIRREGTGFLLIGERG